MNHSRAFARTPCWIVLLIALSCTQPQHPDPAQNIAIEWTWKRTANEDANVIYGAVQNKGDQPLREIVLEFSTQNREGQIVNAYEFSLTDLSAGEQKLFTKDYPAQAALEDSGFVRIKRVIPAD